MRCLNWKKIAFILLVMNLYGCAHQRYDLGFNADLSGYELANKKEVEVWVAPVKVPDMRYESLFHNFPQEAQNFFEQETRESLIRNMRPIKQVTASSEDNQPDSADYALEFSWNKYETLKGMNPFVLLAGPFLGLFDPIGHKISCNYLGQLRLLNGTGELLMQKQSTRSAEFLTSLEGESGALSEKDDLCYQARSEIVERLLTDAFSVINQQ